MCRGGGPGEGLPPPAYWPPGSPQVSRCRRGAMPGRQGRMSGTPPPRRSPGRAHSCLTACPGPRVAGHGRWQGGNAPSARAASLASSAAHPPTGRPRSSGQPRGLAPLRESPTLIPTPATRVPSHSPVTLFPLVMPLRGASRPQVRQERGRSTPPRGACRALGRVGGQPVLVGVVGGPRRRSSRRGSPGQASSSTSRGTRRAA
jgi:hypothetical protein